MTAPGRSRALVPKRAPWRVGVSERRARWTAVATAALVLLGAAGCAAPPVSAPVPRHAPPPSATEAVTDAGLERFLRRQHLRAQAAAAAGRWAEAALAYEVLALVEPDDPAYAAARDEWRRRVDAAAAEHFAAAEGLRRRGELDAAARAHLHVLSLDPGHAGSADALRAVERERNRRTIVGRFSRQLLARRPASDGEANGYADARNQIEHATLLARQGDLEAAIALLRDGLRGQGDAARRGLLADLHVQRAETLRLRDPQSARASVEAALALDPGHAAARALARQLAAARGSAP